MGEGLDPTFPGVTPPELPDGLLDLVTGRLSRADIESSLYCGVWTATL